MCVHHHRRPRHSTPSTRSGIPLTPGPLPPRPGSAESRDITDGTFDETGTDYESQDTEYIYRLHPGDTYSTIVSVRNTGPVAPITLLGLPGGPDDTTGATTSQQPDHTHWPGPASRPEAPLRSRPAKSCRSIRSPYRRARRSRSSSGTWPARVPTQPRPSRTRDRILGPRSGSRSSTRPSVGAGSGTSTRLSRSRWRAHPAVSRTSSGTRRSPSSSRNSGRAGGRRGRYTTRQALFDEHRVVEVDQLHVARARRPGWPGSAPALRPGRRTRGASSCPRALVPRADRSHVDVEPPLVGQVAARCSRRARDRRRRSTTRPCPVLRKAVPPLRSGRWPRLSPSSPSRCPRRSRTTLS